MTPTEWEIVTLGLLAKFGHLWPTSAPDVDFAVREFVKKAKEEWQRAERVVVP